MDDHTWTLERAAAFAAGGLDAADAQRLQSHTRDCADCAAAVADAVTFDRTLGTLFPRPAFGLEDRAVVKLRTARASLVLSGLTRRVAMAAAVLLALGGVGAFAASMVKGRLPLPGARETAQAQQESTAKPTVESGVASDPIEQAALQHHDEMRSRLGSGDALVRNEREAEVWREKIDAQKRELAQLVAQTSTTDANGLAPPGVADGRNRIGVFAPMAGGFNGGIGGGFGGGGFGGIQGAGGFQGGAFQNGQLFNATGRQAVGYTNSFNPTTYKWALPQPIPPAAEPKPNAAAPKPALTEDPPKVEPVRRVVIRSGDMEFEVESFDGALATVTKLVTTLNGAFVATVNSEKLPNGKVKGAVTVRTPPEHLDTLVLDLRRELGKGGELKGVRVGSQDITKQYTDLESRLKAARTMEQRLLQIIKEGKGEIKQLLEAERELGVWRTKIEETEGELRYYSNLAALSTLTLTLAEKEIRTAAGLTESERVQAGVEVDDVDKAYQQLLAAVIEAKGRVSKSELKQLAAGQFNAGLSFEVSPDSGGPLRDRLRQLGRVARLEIDRVQQADGGPVPKDARVKRGDTVFIVQLYNLAGIPARETTDVRVAVRDVAAAYQAVRDAVSKVTAKVLAAQLNEQDPRNVTATFNFEVKRTDDAAIRAALDAAGEVVSRQVTRAAESDAVTDTKVLYQTSFLPAGGLSPRETTTLALDVPDVEQAATVFAAQVAEAKGRQVTAQSARDRTGKATARLVYEVPLAAAAGVVERFKAAGAVRLIESARDPRSPDTKFATARIDVSLALPDRIVADDGLWPPVRRGLAYSASVLMTSLTWVVFGLCVVLPWGVVGYGLYRLLRRSRRAAAPPTA